VIPIPVPGRDRLLRLLTRALPFGEGRELPLHDPTPDLGLFGPGSVTWRVMREPLLILGGGRALLLQAAHPLVAQGAIDHSTYASDPFGRLSRTIHWVTMVSFGTTAEARAASRTVNRQHRRVSGVLPAAHATGRVRSPATYTATDPELLLWVHATFVDTMITAHDALVGGLTQADRDGFVREWHAVARLMHVPAPLLWDSHAQMRAYVDDQVSRGPVRPGAGSRLVSRTVLRPPLPSPALRPLWDVVAFTTVGMLPAALRRGYGITWTPAHDAAHRGLRLWLRGARAALPERFRTSPVHDLALLRSGGDWPDARGRAA
jgi:uncharacterized protein (DUF2236 family)